MFRTTVRRNRRVAWLSVSFLATLVAGCVGEAPAIAGSSEGAPAVELLTEWAMTAADLGATGAAMRVEVEVVEPSRIYVGITFGRADQQADLANECGHTRYRVPSNAENFRWAEARGRALIVGTDGEPQVVETDRAPESWALATNLTGLQIHDAAAGDRVVLDLAMGDPTSRLYHPRVNMSAPEGAFRLLRSERSAFACGATLADFEGTIAHVGVPPMGTVVRDAAIEILTTNGTEAHFMAHTGTSRPGPCDLSVAVDDRVVMETGAGVITCTLDGVAPAGSVAFRIHALAGSGPTVGWFVADRAPWS